MHLNQQRSYHFLKDDRIQWRNEKHTNVKELKIGPDMREHAFNPGSQVGLYEFCLQTEFRDS